MQIGEIAGIEARCAARRAAQIGRKTGGDAVRHDDKGMFWNAG